MWLPWFFVGLAVLYGLSVWVNRGSASDRLIDKFRLPANRPKIRPLHEQTAEDMTLEEAQARIISLRPLLKSDEPSPPAKKPRR